MSTGVAISVEGVHQHFMTDAGPVLAVNGITVAVDPGASLAITGPSGCGKSTLLSVIGALEPPSEGRVTIGEEVVSEMAEPDRARVRREQLGFVFQSHNLQPFLTAVENISLQLSLVGASEGYGRSLELLGTLGLAHVADKYPDQLSGGERQRVAVARALVHQPRLLLADEPTGSLDADNSLAVIDLLLEAQLETGATLIVITHAPEVAARLDRNIALRDGQVLGERSIREPEKITETELAGV